MATNVTTFWLKGLCEVRCWCVKIVQELISNRLSVHCTECVVLIMNTTKSNVLSSRVFELSEPIEK